jgi:Xaa-Pro aminopeptidase
MKPNFFYLLFFINYSLSIFAQEQSVSRHLDYYQYDADRLSTAFTQNRRAAFRDKMADGTVAIFLANSIKNRSNDVDFEFHQQPNFYYLTGFTEPNAALILFKDSIRYKNVRITELLLLQDRDVKSEIWDGRRLGVLNAKAYTGITAVEAIEDFEMSAIDWKDFSTIWYDKTNFLLDENRTINAPLNKVKQNFSMLFNRRKIKTDEKQLIAIMAELREVKLDEELTFLQKAIDITCKAQIELMKSLTDGMAEYQSEAILEYVFKNEGAEYTGFPSIQGGGENSCILHYTSNRKVLSGKHLLVSDVGAEYRGYTADVTRTLPVDGVFSEEEKTIYNLVLKAQNAGIRAAKAGNPFRLTHEATTEVITQGLLKLGIIRNAKEVRNYFMHGTSHYLGLDVHDMGTYGPLKPGNVITVEPGIYISEGSECDPKWWNIGVRIEDDILITEQEPINLSKAAPRTVEAIEEMMRKASNF